MLTQPSTARQALAILRGRAPVPAPAPQQRAALPGTGISWGGTRQAGPTVVLGHGEHDYSVSAAAYRSAEYVATNLASVDLTVARPDGSVQDAHPVATLWNAGTPGASFSARTARQVMFLRAELSGEALAYIDRGATGTDTPRGLYPIFDPVEVHVRRALDDQGQPTGQEELVGFVVLQGRVTGGVQARVPLLPTEVLWLRYPHPFKPWAAQAPWQAALHAVESDHWARAWQLGEYRNGARPSHVIDLGAVSDDTDTRVRAEYRSEIEGPGNAGKALIISASEDAIDGGRAPSVHRLTMTPAEMSYLESRAANAREVFLAFGLRPDLFMGQATYENQRAAKTAAWSDRLLPALDVLGSELDRQLLPAVGEQAAWDLSQVDALQENADAIYGRLRGIAYADVLTMDEMREQVGYGPLPNGLGALTLTGYRNALGVQQLEAVAALGVTLAGATASGERLAPRRLRLAVRGRTITERVGHQVADVSRETRAMTTPGQAYATRAGLTPKRVLALYARHEKAGKRAVARLAARQEKAVLRELKAQARAADPTQLAARIKASDLFDATFWRGETVTALEPFLAAVWAEGGNRAADGFGLDWSDVDDQVHDAMASRLDVLAGQVTDTTRAVIEAQVLKAGVEGGESVDELADRIRAKFAELSTSRAETIARTETVGGFNAAAHTVAGEAEGDYDRVWLATDDDDTRRSHRSMDGERAKPGKPYSNRLMFPGDPSGKPSETVNCRCVELFEESR